jgi:hypothetical protein
MLGEKNFTVQSQILSAAPQKAASESNQQPVPIQSVPQEKTLR